MDAQVNGDRVARGRQASVASYLRRAAFQDVPRAQQLLADNLLNQVLQGSPDSVQDPHERLSADVGQTADPDRALLSLVRIVEAAREHGPDAMAALRSVLTPHDPDDPLPRQRLFAVLGASAALGDELVRHPELTAVVGKPHPLDDGPGQPARFRAQLLQTVGADPTGPNPIARDASTESISALRLTYRSILLQICATDLTEPDPYATLEAVAAALADLAGAALEAALAIARADQDDDGVGVRFAVIGMGKCGGRELNYVSDVDVIYVVEPESGFDEEHALQLGAHFAAAITRVCSAPSSEPPLWPVDTALRPEGADGPIVRTLMSHRTYYERWAKTWEFQALLRARSVAGDMQLGADYLDAVHPLVWRASARENFVTDSQAMRKRVEQHIPAAEAERQLKLGPGGLRDIEFTVQLLQLVHGRSDQNLRSPHTLEALAALAAGGYVGRQDATRMAEHYRFLRVLEHRIQLDRMRRSHLLPTSDQDLLRLGRAIGLRTDVVPELLARVRSARREVRELHEALFFRPLLPAVAQLAPPDITMTPQAVRTRLEAIGYRDPAGALHHLQALTRGVSRTAAIQRQLLPAMLGWFAQGADPDAGLLGFRQLSDELGATPWYLKLLRDSRAAAPRLAHVLASSPYLVQALSRSPESIKWLASDSELAPLPPERLLTEVHASLARASDTAAMHTLRAIRRRELARAATAEVLHLSDPIAAASAITNVTDAVLTGTLEIAENLTRVELGLTQPPTAMLVVAMGRLGGREPGYGSDADVLFVHEPHDAHSPAHVAHTYATAVATRFRSLLNEVGPEPGLEIDADLRPEGRNGPLVRTLDSYREYYSRWGQTWERQALLRARPIAGDPGLGNRFTGLIDQFRFPSALTPSELTEIRRIKARVERERLPRAVTPARHLKLGPGTIGDVEWTAQLLQLQNAHAHPELHTTSTLETLAGLENLGLMTADDAAVLRRSWLLSSAIRNALTLWTGRTSGTGIEVLPSDRRALAGVARLMDYPAGAENELEEDFLRAARRARRVVERIFYGKPVAARDGL